MRALYRIGASITGAITFIACWLSTLPHISSYWALTWTWIPSLVLASVAGLLWPVIAVIALWAFVA